MLIRVGASGPRASSTARGAAGAVVEGLAQIYGLDPDTPASDFSRDERQGLATAAIAFAALTPDFLLR
ncbi:MAG: hypothetical protein EAZ40_09770 [Rhodobacterales bacterium]|nr:MAG: hypothetical protein EAZ40_09770 [Rhodobacterales bacterium]